MRVKELQVMLEFMPPDAPVVVFDRREEEWVEPEAIEFDVQNHQVKVR